mmetsp:Transcript_12459/g.33630  ORF Transcript_12459/g.33630 Transcript_12459/m.33630 type:complete len:591 (-) Transcript_12459:169-1941(-)|eukprot:CAMPEP_0185839180 /NCGR_PEP_ID=MMETSP1353-20130828/14181_1 /TAXON_ID=1077150 /ORGANISM="Erythrolobus australicus, Strain CCMP3124" /LENGTH=590 /DNA_ID=CAMNT_0028538305 /DNA_START=118 /DNA_END=1890 /DNA_ORIENTATION=+
MAQAGEERANGAPGGAQGTESETASHAAQLAGDATVSSPPSVLYTWGRAKNFRLGRRHVNVDSRVPERVDSDSLAGRGVLAAACGGGHTCVLLDDHTLRVFGYSQYGQLGVGDRVDLCEPTMPKLRAPLQSRQLASADGNRGFPQADLSALQEKEAALHSVKAGDGITGDGGAVQDESDSVVDVSCGRYHTVALTRAGHVYSWGGGKNGRLGHGDEKIHTSPVRVEAFVLNGVRVTAIASGYHSNLALSESGELFSWGWGAHGQLGHGSTTDSMIPRRIDALCGLSIAAIACGDRHSFAITEEGQLFGWGSNEYNQLGTGKRGEVLASPALIKGLMGLPIKQISSGDRHTAAVTTLGAVYTWGCGSDGQIGQGDFRDALRPRLVARLVARVDRVQCGHNFTLALTDTRELFAWGANVYGQLGNGGSAKSCIPVPVTLPSGAALKGISCAHFHCVLWTSAAHEAAGHGTISQRLNAQDALTRTAGDNAKRSQGNHRSFAPSTHINGSPAAPRGSNIDERSDIMAKSQRDRMSAQPRQRSSRSGVGGTMLEALQKLERSYSATLEACNAELVRLNRARDELISCIDERALDS